MNDSEYTIADYRKAACWIVCPLCDEVVCEGRFECPQVNKWIEEMMKEKGETNLYSRRLHTLL